MLHLHTGIAYRLQFRYYYEAVVCQLQHRVINRSSEPKMHNQLKKLVRTPDTSERRDSATMNFEEKENTI